MLTELEKKYLLYLMKENFKKYKEEKQSILGPPLKLFDSEKKYEEFHKKLTKKLKGL